MEVESEDPSWVAPNWREKLTTRWETNSSFFVKANGNQKHFHSSHVAPKGNGSEEEGLSGGEGGGDLILDLRMKGGGSSTVTYPILEYITHGKLGEFVSRKESRPLEIRANPIQNSQTVPLIVMVSQDTVSFGEIFSGVMQDSGRAKIVGETSLGNVEVLSGFDFDDGSLMWLAAETFHSAFSDANWEQSGIIPNVQAFAPWDTFYFDTDPSIKAAVELLGHKWDVFCFWISQTWRLYLSCTHWAKPN